MKLAEKAEQLRLPEQLYILLMNPDTGQPRFDKERVRRVLSMSILWELMDSGAVRALGTDVTEFKEISFTEFYMMKSANFVSTRIPENGSRLALEMAAELHPVWDTIGNSMLSKHLLTEQVRTRFCFFHQRVLTELSEARQDGSEMLHSLQTAARQIWNANYDDSLAHTHPRILARIILLDNYGLLEPLIGASAYSTAAPHLPKLRAYLHEIISKKPAEDPDPVRSDASYSNNDSYIYNSDSDFWISDPDSGHHGSDGHGHGHDASGDHGGHDGSGGHGGHDGSGGHGGHDSSGGHGGHDGGGGDSGGDCGGCGGCGG